MKYSVLALFKYKFRFYSQICFRKSIKWLLGEPSACVLSKFFNLFVLVDCLLETKVGFPFWMEGGIKSPAVLSFLDFFFLETFTSSKLSTCTVLFTGWEGAGCSNIISSSLTSFLHKWHITRRLELLVLLLVVRVTSARARSRPA